MSVADMLGALADALAAAAASANQEGEDASTDKWAVACFGRAEGLRRARMMVLELGGRLAAAEPDPDDGHDFKA